MSRLVAFFKDETGATAIEYGLIAAGISVVIIASVNAIGSKLNSTFQTISDSLKYIGQYCDAEAAGNGGFLHFQRRSMAPAGACRPLAADRVLEPVVHADARD